MRLQSIRLGLGALLLCLSAGVLDGSQSSTSDRKHWWWSETYRSELALSDQQSRQLDSIYQTVLPRLRAERDEFARQDQALSALLSGAADEAAVGQAIERVEQARTAASKTRTWMLYRMYRVLQPEQRGKLAEIHRRLERERAARPCGDGAKP